MSSEIVPCNLQRLTHRPPLVSLVVLLLCSRPSAGCNSGLFGPKCQYQCRCTQSRCDYYGECQLNARCHNGYFGPSCQYFNMAIGQISTQGWLYDNNDTTCNPNTSSADVTVTFYQPAAMTWLRVHVRNPQSISDASSAINIKLNGTQDCVGKRVYLFPPGIFDVSCDNYLVTSSITISGSITPHICSIYVSGGRNVAYLQSNTLIGSQGNVSTQNPVDENFACMTAQSRISASEISITFDQAQLLYKIVLGVPADMVSNNTLSIKTYLGSAMAGSPRNVIVDKEIMTIFIPDPKPADRITVSVAPEVEFCELETFGDTLCGRTLYGFECQKLCQCASNEVCFPVTGMCAPKCTSGKYGDLCSQSCSSGCAGNTCDYQTGKCACKPEFQDDTVCEQGCSENCKTVCDNATKVCDECKDGYFGPSCWTSCSKNCMNGVCNKATGHCSSCQAGYFGPNCTTKCQDGCLNSVCNFTTGGCLQCKPSRFGLRDCSSPDSFNLLWLALLIIPLLLGCIIVAYCLARKKKTTSTHEELVKAEDNKSLKLSPPNSWTFTDAAVSAVPGQDASTVAGDDISQVGSHVE